MDEGVGGLRIVISINWCRDSQGKSSLTHTTLPDCSKLLTVHTAFARSCCLTLSYLLRLSLKERVFTVLAVVKDIL